MTALPANSSGTTPVVGYVLKAFPQMSETFVEHEVRVLGERGVQVELATLSEPAPGLAGPTELPPGQRHLVGRTGALVRSTIGWTVRRPVVVGTAVIRALRARSQTMLRGVANGTWIATRFRSLGVRQIHAHFATDAASATMVAAELIDVPWSFTIHARELYLRTAGLCAKCRTASAVVTVCDYNVRELARVCPGHPTERLHVVYCGVDVDRFPARTAVPDRSYCQLVSVGRLVAKKGFADLIDAVAALARTSMDVRLDVIGSGELLDTLVRRAHAAGVDDRVRFLGSLEPYEVAAAIRDADLFVLANVIAPDGDRDSMPVVTKEAMASAVPVVTTDCVANAEMVDDEVGRLVPPGDPAALAAAIAELMSLPATARDALGRSGRRRVEERFSLHRETAKIHTIFDDLA